MIKQILTIEIISGSNDRARILIQELKVDCKVLNKLSDIFANIIIKMHFPRYLRL